MVKIPQSFFLFSTSWLHQISSVPSSFGEINKHILPFSLHKDFPCGSAGKESACNVGVQGLIPGLGRSPGERKSYPLQYTGLENSMNCIVHGVTELDTTEWLSVSLFSSFTIDWFDLLAVQGTLKNVLQHCSSKASILCAQPFFVLFSSHIHIWLLEKYTLLTWWKWKSVSHVQLFATPWTIQFMEFSSPEYWSG